MAKRIFKYTFPDPDDVHIIKAPEGLKAIKFAEQYGIPCVWAEVEENAPLKTYKFYLQFTGKNVPENSQYIGTDFFDAVNYGIDLVIHCYMVNE